MSAQRSASSRSAGAARSLACISATAASRWQRRACLGLLGAAVVVCVLGLTAITISTRVERVAISFPEDGKGDTWVIVGSDSRAGLPTEAAEVLEDPIAIPGARADVVLVVQVKRGEVTVLSIPRDLLVQIPGQNLRRLAQTIDPDPQALIDALCSSLGIPADRLLMIDLAGLLRVVDTIGPIQVHLDQPTRDPAANLLIDGTGDVMLDSAQALALVRSRHPQQLVDGIWVDVNDGATWRARWGAEIFSILLHRMRQSWSNPIRTMRIAWAVSESVTTDDGMTAADAVGLANLALDPLLLASEPIGGSIARHLTRDGEVMLADLGFGQPCVPAR